MLRSVIALAACAVLGSLSPSASAQMVKSQVTASNGVIVDVNSDAFAGRSEYSAPDLKFGSQGGANGFAFVAKVRKGTVLGALNVQGFIMYSGEWRFFKTALFKGGDPVKYVRTDGKVGSCRYGCSLTESFQMEFTPAQIAAHTENGILSVQIRADSGDTAILNIPVSYLVAVNELAK